MPYGLIGIGIAIALTLLICIWLDYFTTEMEKESCDEYKAEQRRLSWEANKKYGCKPNKLTAINAVNQDRGIT